MNTHQFVRLLEKSRAPNVKTEYHMGRYTVSVGASTAWAVNGYGAHISLGNFAAEHVEGNTRQRRAVVMKAALGGIDEFNKVTQAAWTETPPQ